ncbi:hypothetical protein BDF21DRAFT_450618 [Thamnidium elegans]|nr:hypothetical protein BDF21DRAFT_450618 [Thamnidium elegans]
MAQKTNNEITQKKHRQGGLPVSIHPDDAKDKVFTAILKALLKMGNKPSSPKELANIIVKHKYATLGGATPFATVSSRISQHFKRAAEHNPPRAPLLAKHVDQNHSRKINYSLATGESASSSSQPTTATTTAATNTTTTEPHDVNNTAAISGIGPQYKEDPSRTNSKTRRPVLPKVLRKGEEADDEEEEEEESDLEEEEDLEDARVIFHPSKKRKSEHLSTPPPMSPSIHPIQQEPRASTIDGYSQSMLGSDDESDGEHSDYHEEMLQGDQDLDILAARRLSRRQSNAKAKSNIKSSNINHTPPNLSFSQHPHEPSISSTNTPQPIITETQNSIPTTTSPLLEKAISPIEPSKITEIDPIIESSIEAKPVMPSLQLPPPSPPVTTLTNIRKPSFSFSSGFPGDQELWTPFSFEHDFDNVFLQEPSTAHHIPFNIATPESVSVSELDNYFSSTSTSSSSNRSQRKSFSSAMLGPNDKSLLQKVLLASAARGVADKIDEEEEEEQPKPKEKEKEKPVQQAPEPSIKSSFSSSSLMDVDNGEDFVKFEDDEKKESPPPIKKVADILPANNNNTTTTVTPTNNTTLSAAEILKSMNIQNLNLSALHQMTSNIPSLQHLSPTFDLAKTMAAYMQSLAKSANANAASSTTNSPHAMDLKSILTRFPALEAFIKKDPVVATPPPMPQPPPLVSAVPGADFIPNLVSATEPIVHTLTPMTPPMYITLIDHIAVCIVVLAKTETTPEYRIMRRVDTGFINGTVLLTAGGIETESERSMILSFEMERVRMPKKKSQLFGTWIPLRRAQELAVTCSIQHKLGHFLEDSIESYFPNPLPIQVNTRKPHRDSRLTALALAALRSDNSKTNGFIVPPISRQSSSSGSMGAAQLQELLLTHPNKALKSNGLSKAPLLGRYDDQEEEPKTVPISTTTSVANSTNGSISGKEESDVDIVNSSDSSVAATSSNEEDSESEDHDTTSNDLEEMISRVTHTNKQPLHIHPRDLQKKRRRSIVKEEEPELKLTKPVRKKSNSTGGKWSSGNNNNSTSKPAGTTITTATPSTKKSSTIIIKKSVTGGGKKATVKKEEDEEDEIDNVVVEHKPVLEASVKPEPLLSPKVDDVVEEEEHADEDDEDEDIDIGGSDFDDDLR